MPRPWHPEPADFNPHPIIGEPVRGLQAWDEGTGTVGRYGASCEINGLVVRVYVSDASDPHDGGPVVNFGASEEEEGVGDIRWNQWGRIREIATMPGDPVAQLMTIARRWCAGSDLLTLARQIDRYVGQRSEAA